MDITRLAIEKNRITAVTLVFVLVAGLNAYRNLPRSEDPGFTVRTALVTTYFPGASPERVEQLVTDKLEKAIQEMPEVDQITSQSKTGVSVIAVDIKERYTDMQPIWDKLRRKVQRAQPDLPESAGRPLVDDEYGDVFGIIISITGDGFSYAELKEIADDVRDDLLLIDDVAKVDIYGAQAERIFVEYSNARLAELGLSPMQLRNIIQSRNIVMPGGDVRTDLETIVLEPSGNFESFEQAKRTVIQLPGQKDLVYLEDVADITRGYIDPPQTMMRSGGEPVLGLAISMREGGDIIELGKVVREAIRRMEAFFPIGVEFDFIQFQPDAVANKVDDFVGNLLQAVAIVTLVMVVTLGLRTGLVVASLIPMAMIMSFMVMSYLDIGLDQVSLAALIIALGMLVDNAIVMSESIMVKMQAGKPAVDAAVDSARELRLPLLTSSLTTAAAFLPIYLGENDGAEYTAPLFKVVTITLLSSWVLSLTMVPLLCVRFLRVEVEPEARAFDSRSYRAYRGFLVSLLRHRLLTLVVVAGIFAVSMMGFGYVPNIFFPPNDRPTFTIELELPTGTPIERTEEIVIAVEEYLRENLLAGDGRDQGVANWGAFIGEGAPRFILPYGPEPPSPNYAYIIVNTTSRDIIDGLAPRIEELLLANFPGLKPTVRPLDLGPPAWPPIEVRLSGRDTDVVFDIADEVRAKLASIPGTKLIDDDWGPRTKKLFANINQPRARRAGVTSEDVAVSLQTFLTGLETTQYREDDKLIPVILRSVAAERKDIEKLETLAVYSQATGESVPLKQVADIEVMWEPSNVRRMNRLRTVTVEAGVEPGVTAAEVVAQLRPWLEKASAGWKPGYYWEFGGSQEASEGANQAIAEQLPIAGLIIVLLLVAQFNSVRRPLIILITIPLGLIGVVVGLLVARSYFGFMTLLGIISLAGIVINNAIVLLDTIRIQIEEHGLAPAQAIVASAQQRLRPILLTTCTTVGGLIPLWLGGGPMFEPMAIAILFGLLFATLLTLGVVPVLYSVSFGVGFKGFRYQRA